MRFAASDMNIFRRLALLSIIFVLSACTETIPVKAFQDQKLVPGHLNCKIELGGYFHEKYGRKSTGDRAVVKLQFTIPEAAFDDKLNAGKKRKYKLAANADNRIIFYVDGVTQAGAQLTSIQFWDNRRNDSVEFNIKSTFGRIGYVEQNKGSLFVRLSDSTGLALSELSDKTGKDRDWSRFIDKKQSVVHLTDSAYRKRKIQTEALILDEINKVCG